MRILIAEDGVGSRRLLPTSRTGWGHEAVVPTDGLGTRAALRQPDAPTRAVLDGVMPGLDPLPMCCCKKIRDDRDYGRQVDEYPRACPDVRFSHGICPPCREREIEGSTDAPADRLDTGARGPKEREAQS